MRVGRGFVKRRVGGLKGLVEGCRVGLGRLVKRRAGGPGGSAKVRAGGLGGSAKRRAGALRGLVKNRRGASGGSVKRRRGALGGVVKRRRGDFGRALVAVLALLAGGGEAALLAVVPSNAGGSATGSRPPALVSATAAPTPLETTRVVALPENSERAGADYYRAIRAQRASKAAAAGFMPLYREAARSFGVSWRLIASIHRQETAFSAAATTYHGLNAFGCCAGPMQFNVTNGPPSTWALYKQSFRLGKRPRGYPHPTRHHPSIYDDFDAIMAAGNLLADAGATDGLDGSSWTAAYAYYGHDLFGTEYASEVLGRARGWERDGFCLNCPADPVLVEEFDAAYGVAARKALETDEDRRKRAKAKAKKRKEAAADRKRRKAAEAARRSSRRR